MLKEEGRTGVHGDEVEVRRHLFDPLLRALIGVDDRVGEQLADLLCHGRERGLPAGHVRAADLVTEEDCCASIALVN